MATVTTKRDGTSRLFGMRCHVCGQRFDTRDEQHVCDLVQLAGSIKQVEWAQQIRTRILGSVDKQVRQAISKAPADDPQARIVTDALDSLRAISDAAWWIDHKDSAPMSTLKSQIG